MLFLGIETGARGTRALVLDLEAARVLAGADEPPVFLDGLPDDHREQDPAQWIVAVDRVVRRCLDALGDRRGLVAALGVAGAMRGIVALDDQNRIVRPAKVEGDRSCGRQADHLARAFGGTPGLIELTGNPLMPSHAGPAILWLKQHEPYHFQRTRTLLLPHDFINYWLTAERRCEFGGASATGLFEVTRCEWARELVDWIDPQLIGMLPPVQSPLEPHGRLRPELSAAWNLPQGVLVAAGAPDLTASVAAAGCARVGDLMLSLGGGADLACVTAVPVADARGEAAALCELGGRWLCAMSLSNGSIVPELIRRHYGWSPAEFESMVGQVPAGAGGLLMLPYLGGERIPSLPEGCGVLHGLNVGNFTPENLARAAVEGVALGIGYGLSRLGDLGLAPTELRLTGPAAKHQLWHQVIADVAGLPVVVPGEFRGPAMGAALQAAGVFFRHNGEDLALADIAAYATGGDSLHRCEPDPATHQLYQEAVSRQQYLVDTLHPAGFL